MTKLIGLDWEYEGDVVDGKRQGNGKCTWADGSSYEGQWFNDQKCGNGIITDNSGNKEGFFLDDSYIGKITIISESGLSRRPKDFTEAMCENVQIRYDNGDVYLGTWYQGRKNGYGRLEHSNRKVEDGFFLNDRFLGSVYSLENAEDRRHIDFYNCIFEGKVWADYVHEGIYQGDWKNGKRHGMGTMKYPDHEYTGNWVDDVRVGQDSILIYTDGTYRGDFKNNKFWGNGRIDYKDGTKFRGKFEDGQRNGSGHLRYEGGIKCSGEWKKGIRDGIFEYAFPNHSKFSGPIKNDRLCGDCDYISTTEHTLRLTWRYDHLQNECLFDNYQSPSPNSDPNFIAIFELCFILAEEVMFRIDQTEIDRLIRILSEKGFDAAKKFRPKPKKHIDGHWKDIPDSTDPNPPPPIDTWLIWS